MNFRTIKLFFLIFWFLEKGRPETCTVESKQVTLVRAFFFLLVNQCCVFHWTIIYSCDVVHRIPDVTSLMCCTKWSCAHLKRSFWTLIKHVLLKIYQTVYINRGLRFCFVLLLQSLWTSSRMFSFNKNGYRTFHLNSLLC